MITKFPEPKKCNRCRRCKRVIREYNKSGYCNSCFKLIPKKLNKSNSHKNRNSCVTTIRK